MISRTPSWKHQLTSMVLRGCLVLLWKLSFFAGESVEQRSKRIVNGLPLTVSGSGYAAAEYYVWIANNHMCQSKAFFGVEYSAECRPPVASDLVCGGSLLTPFVVQTGCHCLSTFSGPTRDNFTTAVIFPHWEKGYVVFPGWKEVSKMKSGVRSATASVHPKCGQLAREQKWLTHDFGIIVLKESVENENIPKSGPLKFAPVYKVQELEAISKSALSVAPICLVLGFGQYQVYVNFENKWWTYGEASDHLKYGWSVHLTQTVIHQYTTEHWPVRNTTFDYNDKATWGGMLNLAKRRDLIGVGDSGGPVTCDNLYLSVMVAAAPILRGFQAGREYQTTAMIFHSLEYNAWEYRRAFIERITEIVADIKDACDAVDYIVL